MCVSVLLFHLAENCSFWLMSMFFCRGIKFFSGANLFAWVVQCPVCFVSFTQSCFSHKHFSSRISRHTFCISKKFLTVCAMKDEIAAAVFFVTQLVKRYGSLDNDSRQSFAAALTSVLFEKYKNHWYLNAPSKGQAYRSVTAHKTGRGMFVTAKSMIPWQKAQRNIQGRTPVKYLKQSINRVRVRVDPKAD